MYGYSEDQFRSTNLETLALVMVCACCCGPVFCWGLKSIEDESNLETEDLPPPLPNLKVSKYIATEMITVAIPPKI
eukprot:4545502-Amphidinium_carterae.1